jgi:hypothetical protein
VIFWTDEDHLGALLLAKVAYARTRHFGDTPSEVPGKQSGALRELTVALAEIRQED